MNNWTFNGQPFDTPPEGMIGFVYRITNTTNQKKYIGRKYFGSYRRVKQKGSKRKKIVRKDSDWRDYTGSSIELNNDIALLGKDKFTFEILIMAEYKGQITYLEMLYQFKYNVLTSFFPDGTKEYYNKAIGSRKFTNLKITDNFITALKII